MLTTERLNRIKYKLNKTIDDKMIILQNILEQCLNCVMS